MEDGDTTDLEDMEEADSTGQEDIEDGDTARQEDMEEADSTGQDDIEDGDTARQEDMEDRDTTGQEDTHVVLDVWPAATELAGAVHSPEGDVVLPAELDIVMAVVGGGGVGPQPEVLGVHQETVSCKRSLQPSFLTDAESGST